MDVRLVLVPEVAQGAQVRVGRGLAEGAQRGLDRRLGEVLQELEVLRTAPCRSHTILIDDRRLMQGHWASVREPQVWEGLKAINPSYRITYAEGYMKDDIIVAAAL